MKRVNNLIFYQRKDRVRDAKLDGGRLIAAEFGVYLIHPTMKNIIGAAESLELILFIYNKNNNKKT